MDVPWVSPFSGKQVDPRTLTEDGSLPTWQFRLLYDGNCPLCMAEVNMLSKRNTDPVPKLDLVDIDSPDYDPYLNGGVTFDAAMAGIHGIYSDGRIVSGMEVFQGSYDAIGLGWVHAILQIPGVLEVANVLYGFWAKQRMAITGRDDLSVILAQKKLDGGCDEACAIPDFMFDDDDNTELK